MTSTWTRILRFMRPPTTVPSYTYLEFMVGDQQALKEALFSPRSPSPAAIAKGQEATAEKYRGLLEEATRFTDREIRLVESSRQLHANAIQFGLVAAGIVASLGAWLNLGLVWLPLIAFILSIASAWWFLCQEATDPLDAVKAWYQNMPETVGDKQVPDRFPHDMYLHLFERAYHNVLRDYRQWLHRGLAVPALLFMAGLLLLLICVAIGR